MTLSDENAERLANMAERITEARATLKDLTAEREQLIREVAQEATFREISSVAGVSYQRISQLVTGKDTRLTLYATMEAYCPTCQAKPGEPCTGTRAHFHAERHDRRMAIHEGNVDDVYDGEPTYGERG